MKPMHWTSTVTGMFVGYITAGPVGGFAGLGLGWWLGRPRPPAARPAAPDKELTAAYRTLGLQPGASQEDVRVAYRRLMNRHHPDKLPAGTTSQDEIRNAQQATQAVRRAYERIRREQG